jgi:hypothetical protein
MQAVLVLSFVLLHLAIAAPTPNADFEVIWTSDKASSQVSLRAWSTDYSTLLGEACDHTLNTGNFASSTLTFNVDENGYGFEATIIFNRLDPLTISQKLEIWFHQLQRELQA